MGNSQSQDEDILVQSLSDKREMDISKRLSISQYRKHTHGENIEGCLTELPIELTEEVSLYENLTASFNLITSIPLDLPLHIPHLRHLNLNHNRIRELPESIALFFHLDELHLSHNLLETLPRNITKMRQLSILDLSNNRFRRVPEDIGQIPGLTKLNLSENQLSLLPASLGVCSTLRVLLAHGNQFLSTAYDADSHQLLEQLRECAPRPPSAAGGQQQAALQFPRDNAPARGHLARLQAQTVATGAVTRTPLLPPAGSSRLDAETLRDALAGLLVGAALGDALGLATDGLSADQCQFHYGEQYQLTDTVRDLRRCRHSAGDWTANTELALVVLESLLHWGGVLDELDLAQRLYDWRRRGLPELADARPPCDDDQDSSLLARVVMADGFTDAPHSTARRHTNRIGSAGDVAPADDAVDWDSCLPAAVICGIPRFHDVSEVAGNAQRVCLTTHADPVCVAGCVAVAAVVAGLLRGDGATGETALRLLAEAADTAAAFLSDSDQQQVLRRCLTQKTTDSLPADDAAAAVGDRQGVLSALQLVSWALQRGADDSEPCWRQLVTRVTRRGARAAVAGSLCGAVIGLRCGYSALPRQLLHQLPSAALQLLHHKLNQLMDLMAL